MRVVKGCLVICLILFSINLVLSADINLRINTELSSVDIQARFNLETTSSSFEGLDSNDFRASTDYSNYSLLRSVVSSENLILDSRPSLSGSEIDLIYSVDSSQSGEVTFSWSYSNENYPLVFYDYGTDSSRTDNIINFSMDNRSSYQFEFSGSPRYFKIRYSYIPPEQVGVCTSYIWSPDPSSVCYGSSFTQTSNCGSTRTSIGTKIGTSWTNTSTRLCISGNIFIRQISECNQYQNVNTGSSCCTPLTTYGDWSTCSLSGNRSRTVTVINDLCISNNSIEHSSCTPLCVEDWSCTSSNECINGFIQQNCVDRNSCGTTDRKPSALSCTINEDGSISVSGGGGGSVSLDPNCQLNLKCEDWTPCSVQNTIDDLKVFSSNNDGIKTRKCVDQNGCLKAPLVEQEKCSLKIFVNTKKANYCGEDYIELYKEGTNYLLARVKDERQNKRTLSMKFILNGNSEPVDCEEKNVGNFIYNLFDKFMSITDLRKIAEAVDS